MAVDSPMHFENDASPDEERRLPKRSLFSAMMKGARHKCPACGKGALYTGYLKVADACSACGEELHHQRADDAPAYFTISIVGKVIVGLFFWLELAYEPPYWLHAIIWLPVLLLMVAVTLPAVKGAIIGLQWANYMHGFDPDFVEGDDIEMPPHDRVQTGQAD